MYIRQLSLRTGTIYLFRRNLQTCTQFHVANSYSEKTGINNDIPSYDLVIVGGGIVGTASAREIVMRHPKLKVAIVEKESSLGQHQTGHNSGVIHAGIYYKPGSLMAKLCVRGSQLAYGYADKKKIKYKKCGKLIVATHENELNQLTDLYKRGQENGVLDLRMINSDEIQKIEPFCKGVKAIHSPHTGIIDWKLVCKHYGDDFETLGGKIHLNFQVKSFERNNSKYPVLIKCKNNSTIAGKNVLTCGGLQSDYLAEMSGCEPAPKIIPFRGEYLKLKRKKSMINGNIYPVPDPMLPFLGVHFTPTMSGEVLLGPNAILAFKKEGYKFSDVNLNDLTNVLTYAGFWKLAWKYLGFGVRETIKSKSLLMIVRDIQKYVPGIDVQDVEFGPTGVRAQALDENGSLINDFIFDSGRGEFRELIMHCRNAPSPGATSSLAIAEVIADKIEEAFLRR